MSRLLLRLLPKGAPNSTMIGSHGQLPHGTESTRFLSIVTLESLPLGGRSRRDFITLLGGACVAARGAGAAGGFDSSPHWFSLTWWPAHDGGAGSAGGISSGIEGIRLDRRAEHQRRVPFCRGQRGRASGDRGRVGSIAARCHRGRRHGGNPGGENCHANHPNRHGDELRSGWNWLGREPQSAWRQRNWREPPDGGTERQAPPTPDRDCFRTRTGGGFVESVKSEYRPNCGANESGSAIAWRRASCRGGASTGQVRKRIHRDHLSARWRFDWLSGPLALWSTLPHRDIHNRVPPAGAFSGEGGRRGRRSHRLWPEYSR